MALLVFCPNAPLAAGIKNNILGPFTLTLNGCQTKESQRCPFLFVIPLHYPLPKEGFYSGVPSDPFSGHFEAIAWQPLTRAFCSRVGLTCGKSEHDEVHSKPFCCLKVHGLPKCFVSFRPPF